MKTHYFQRYHGKENVATANTMLLLSRLYSYSSDKFFRFLKSKIFPETENFEPELAFSLQEKGPKSIPDATISQDGFKIHVETKLNDKFNFDQLTRHLSAFKDEKIKILLTLAPKPMSQAMSEKFKKYLTAYNLNQTYPIFHINTTFQALANGIQEVIDDRDIEMNNILQDYQDYCDGDNLIPKSSSWMRMQLSRDTFEYNVQNDIYRDNAERNFRAHDYLGLYKDKSIRAIGKICARITALELPDNTIDYDVEFGELTEDRKNKILKLINDEAPYGHGLKNTRYRYFFVEHFYQMDYKKTSRGGSMGTKYFDLSQILAINKIPNTERIAELLTQKSWE